MKRSHLKFNKGKELEQWQTPLQRPTPTHLGSVGSIGLSQKAEEEGSSLRYEVQTQAQKVPLRHGGVIRTPSNVYGCEVGSSAPAEAVHQQKVHHFHDLAMESHFSI